MIPHRLTRASYQRRRYRSALQRARPSAARHKEVAVVDRADLDAHQNLWRASITRLLQGLNVTVTKPTCKLFSKTFPNKTKDLRPPRLQNAPETLVPYARLKSEAR